MIKGLLPYPTYRRSAHPWLGEIPAHWSENRSKHYFREVDEKSQTGEEELMSVSHKTGVTPRQKHVTMFQAESNVGHKICRPGDIAINTMWAFMGALGVARQIGLVSPSYGVYRPLQPGEYDGDYLDALLRIEAYKSEYLCRSTGITSSRMRLYPDEFLRIPLLFPPPEEQAAIVRFVNYVDRYIRLYIRAKRRLIALLNEQKEAIVHRAVTQGLDPNVRLKPSGNAWFPEIPEDWDVLSMRRVIHHAIDGPHHSPSYLDEGVPFLSARNIKADSWSLDDVKYISEADYQEFCRRVTPEPGDVLYTKGGTTGVARAVDLTFAFQVWVHVAVLKLKKRKVTPRYLAAALNTPRCYEQSQLFTRGATNQDLGLGRMKSIVLPVPPIEGQNAIVSFTERKSSRLLAAISSAEREIELIREYRTALIADVVTGKLDVRDAASRLPEESKDGDVSTDYLLEEDDVELYSVPAEVEA